MKETTKKQNNYNILVLLPWVPYPLASGGSTGVFNMLKYVKQAFNVHVWFPLRPRDEERVKLFRDAIGHDVKVFSTKIGHGRNVTTARTLSQKFNTIFLKNSNQYQHDKQYWGFDSEYGYDKEILEDIEHIISEYHIDLVQAEFNSAINYVYALPSEIKKVFIHHELLFMRQKRQLTFMPDKTVYDTYRFNRQFSEEIAALNKYDCVITLSDVDKDILQESGVTTRIESSPLFIPLSHETYPPFKAASNNLVFLAGGGHKPNKEGFFWFIRNVHPLLSAKTNYTLHIVGPNWEDQKYLEANYPIKVHGFIDDLSEMLPGKLMIVPLLSGSGMKMKILESVNNSVPFVTTSVGAEGMGFVDGHDCYIADESETFAEKIYALMHDNNLQHDFVFNARNHYEQTYSPGVLGRRRVDILKSIME